MYVEFTAYCDETWDMNPESLAEISKLLPYADWVTDSGSGGEDESGREYMCYCIGEDDFYGITELDGDELEEAEKSNEIEVLETYLTLLPLEGTHILSIWINDGGQFGKYYTEDYVRARLSELSSSVS